MITAPQTETFLTGGDYMRFARPFRTAEWLLASALLAGAVIAQGAGVAVADGGGGHDGWGGHDHGKQRAALFVSPSASPGNADRSCETAAYSTIQSAVDAAPKWSTVVVCGGTYHEQVVISAPLSLEGRHATIDEAGVTPSLSVTPPGSPQPVTIFAGVAILSSHVDVNGFTVQDAQGEGILAAGLTGTISDIAIEDNAVTNNDLGGGVPPASSYFQCAPNGQIPGDCGEAVHLLSVAYSQVVENFISGNSGGILLTDETGPTHDNAIVGNTVTNNAFDCGITAPGHNSNALNAEGVRQPSVAGVYDNVIWGNHITDNGLKGEGAGVLFANAGPGTASYNNLVIHNYIAGNELAGVTLHAHTLGPGQFEDLSGNRIIDNAIGKNNIGGDPLDSPRPPAPPSAEDLVTTGVLVFSGGTPVQVTIARNRVFDNAIGIWLSAPVAAVGLASNTFHAVSTPISAGN